jgi:TldD protein
MMGYFSQCSKILEKNGIKYSDLRINRFCSETIVVEDENVSSIKENENTSYGIRVFYNGAWGFVYGNDLKRINHSCERAIKLAKLGSRQIKTKFEIKDLKTLNDIVQPMKQTNPMDVDIADKIKKLMNLNASLKRKNVKNRTSTAAFSVSEEEFYNSVGSEILQTKYHMGLRSTIVGKEGNEIGRAVERTGKMSGYEQFEVIDEKEVADRIYESLLRALKAEHAPAGKFPIIVDNELCEVFFHEAVGHACEADAVLEGTSVLGDKLGRKIAPQYLTLVDTPLVNLENGYYKYDDEGAKSQETVLINDGILNKFMQSLETASRMKTEPTGNGRAESPASTPYPRMSNTVLLPGDYSFDELIEGIKSGIYAKGSSGGVVEPNNGNFLFNAQEAFLIKNGKLTVPLKDVSLCGNILDILPKIEKIGKDDKPTFYGGRCGKKGQLVPVGGKAPHIKISEAMIGGQNIK